MVWIPGDSDRLFAGSGEAIRNVLEQFGGAHEPRATEKLEDDRKTSLMRFEKVKGLTRVLRIETFDGGVAAHRHPLGVGPTTTPRGRDPAATSLYRTYVRYTRYV